MTSGTVSCCTMNFFPRRILVTGLLLINTISLLVPNDCNAFPVSQRLLDETVVSDYGMVQKDYGTVPNHQRPLSTVPKCMNATNKIYESNLRLRKRRKRVGKLKEALVSQYNSYFVSLSFSFIQSKILPHCVQFFVKIFVSFFPIWSKKLSVWFFPALCQPKICLCRHENFFCRRSLSHNHVGQGRLVFCYREQNKNSSKLFKWSIF